MSHQLQKELIDVVRFDVEVDDYKVILYNYLFTQELDFPVLHFEKEDDSFILHVLPDDLQVRQLRLIDDAFDEFELVFMPVCENLMRLKFVYRGE